MGFCFRSSAIPLRMLSDQAGAMRRSLKAPAERLDTSSPVLVLRGISSRLLRKPVTVPHGMGLRQKMQKRLHIVVQESVLTHR